MVSGKCEWCGLGVLGYWLCGYKAKYVKMNIFLEHIAKQIFEKYGSGMDQVWMVFPGRRASMYFSRYLSALVKTPAWMPRMMTISELFHSLSDLQPVSPLYANIRLYSHYRAIHPEPEPFDAFYPWGEMVLNDFNEVDKYLVDPAMIFRNIRSLKEIDEHFDFLSGEQKEAIKWFWSALPPDRLSPQRKEFLKLWSLLPELYTRLRQDLRLEGFGYEGMICRDVVAGIRTGELLPPEAGRICFVGFSALSACEKSLFRHLKGLSLASFYWDHDTWYTDHKRNEAGFFIRENLLEFPMDLPGMDFSVMNRQQREVNLIRTSSRIEEARMVPHILSGIERAGEASPNHVAVVLADESLLMPLMYSLPPEVKEINVTMGYPLKDSPVYPLLYSLFRLLQQTPGSRGERRFRATDVLELLNQQLVRDLDREACGEMIEKLKRSNRLFVPASMPGKHPVFGFLFNTPAEPAGISSYLLNVLYLLFRNVSGDREDEHHRMTREFIYQVYAEVKKMHELIREEGISMEFSTYLSLLRKHLQALRIPFSGEPLAGVQIMGLMETRSLDFEHVILLSANEGFLPASHTAGSFIPYNLRKGFELPVTEHQDSIWAYYFYRLLQRAGKVWLVYTGVDKGTVTGEPSRFIHQLRFDSRIRVKELHPQRKQGRIIPLPVTVPKSASVMARFMPYLGEGGQAITLTPSALNNYIDCTLRFYYRYIAGIEEPDEPTGNIDHAGFGSILHHAMKVLYQEKTGSVADAGWLGRLGKDHRKIENALQEAFREVWFRSEEVPVLEGNLALVKEIMKKYIEYVLRIDRNYSPFTIIGLERKYSAEMGFTLQGEQKKVLVGGTIDRIDEKDGRIRTVDYKTGSAGLEFKGVSSLFARGANTRNKAAFQTILYARAFLKATGTGMPVEPGLYFLRLMHRDDFEYRLIDSSNNGKRPVVDVSGLEQEFIAGMKELLSELFDPEVPFHQAADRNICLNCPYNRLCSRDG